MNPTSSLTYLCIATTLALSSCRSDKERSVNTETSKEPSNEVTESIDPFDAKFEEWESAIAAATDPKARHKITWAVSGDESVPAYRALKFIVEHRNEGESIVGDFVRIMHRITAADPIEATRCYELIATDPKANGQMHLLGTALGQKAPAFGLEWLEARDYSREVYFASVNLGTGFADYAGSHPIEEVEPLFDQFLNSPLFEGKAYDDTVKPEGSRMRERMADNVLESLAREGLLDPAVCERLKPRIPEKCVPHLDSYQVYGWTHEKILHEFNEDQFPTESRGSAIAIAAELLTERTTLDETLAWIGKIKNRRSRNAAFSNTYHDHLMKADENETKAILRKTDDPEQLKTALTWANYKARNDRNETMKAWLKDFEASLRANRNR